MLHFVVKEVRHNYFCPADEAYWPISSLLCSHSPHIVIGCIQDTTTLDLPHPVYMLGLPGSCF